MKWYENSFAQSYRDDYIKITRDISTWADEKIEKRYVAKKDICKIVNSEKKKIREEIN